jgi:hypothetical protein
VQYDVQAPTISVDESQNRREAAIKALSSKKADWHYEREWRLLTKPGAVDVPGSLKIRGQNPVKGIYFGFRTELEAIDVFRRGLAGVRNDSIKLYRPTLIDRIYKFQWEEIGR